MAEEQAPTPTSYFRFEEVRYGTGYTDESGEYVSTGSYVKIQLREYRVIKRTPKGVRIDDYSGEHGRFISDEWTKQWACPTVEAARASFIARKWKGRVWCNPPYSKVDPWVDKMVDHGDGLLLVGGKSPDTRWCQKALETCEGAYFFKGRLLFHHPDGKKSDGKWMPNLLMAFGERNYDALFRLPKAGFPGVLMRRDILL